jgi:EmrB/QacA subfamily drug resistance transporter
MVERLDYKWLVAAVYVLALFVSLLDLTITNVALPSLALAFGASPSAIAWVATGYLLSVAVSIPVSGWLGDRFGTKRTFLAALAVFTVGSLLCGLAWNVESLVGFRVLQGVGGGLLTPVGAAMVFRAFPLAERARAASLITVPAVVAPALGPVIGGYLVEAHSWRWIFLVNLPLGVAGMALASRLLREHRVAGAGRLDLPGFALAAAGLAGLLFALGEVGERGLGNARVLAVGAAAILALAAFVVVERRDRQPLIDLRLYHDPLFAAGNLVLFCANAGFFGIVFLLPMLLQGERGLGPLASGLTTFPTAVGIMLVAPLAGRLYPTVGPRRLVMAGMGLAALVAIALREIGPETSLWAIRALMLPLGFAFGLVFIPLQAASFAGIAPDATGRATAAYNAVRQVATGVGIALLAAVLGNRLGSDGAVRGDPAAGGGALVAFGDAFAAAALINLAGLGAAVFLSDRLAAATMGGPPVAAEARLTSSAT